VNPETSVPSGISPAGGRPAPAGRGERWWWLFMRVSGVLLLFLALGHLAIMHLINNVGTIDYYFVALRFTQPFWRVYDGLMLVLALFHGMNGMRTILDDYLKGKKRTAAMVLLYLFWVVFGVVGIYALVAFEPKA
jgi:succinate dehydrogenase / fumarate reductase, membrane anchor subunit